MSTVIHDPILLRRWARHLGCTLVCAALSFGALAQEDKKNVAREREALRRLQTQAQQLNTQVQNLEAERGKLATDFAAKDKELSGLKSELQKRSASESRLKSELKTRIAKVSDELTRLESRFVEVSGQLKEMTERNVQQEAALKARDAEIRDLQAKLAEQREIIGRQGRMLSDSEQKNVQLVKIARDLMARYKDKGVVDALLQKEPFTRIEKVRLQNALQEFEEKVDAHRIALPDLGG